MASGRQRLKGRKEKSPFTALPWHVLDHPDVSGLSGNAFKLLVYMARQYRGRNNGDLSAAYGVMTKYGAFKSKDTLQRAKEELLSKGLLIQTREGRFTNPGGVCALYALAWQPIDDCDGKLEVKSTAVAPRSFKADA